MRIIKIIEVSKMIDSGESQKGVIWPDLNLAAKESGSMRL
jgi:hypothetical protein